MKYVAPVAGAVRLIESGWWELHEEIKRVSCADKATLSARAMRRQRRVVRSDGATVMSSAGSEERGGVDSQWAVWMASAQAGDRAAYDNLLRACIPLIKRVARGQGVGPENLEDVVQETLLSVHRARHTYDPGRSITAWLRMIAQRRAIDALRRRSASAKSTHQTHTKTIPMLDTSPMQWRSSLATLLGSALPYAAFRFDNARP